MSWNAGHTRTSVAAFRAACEDIARQVDDPCWGLHAGCQLAGESGAVPPGIERLAPLLPYALRGLRLSVAADGREMLLGARMDGEPPCLGRHGNELLLSLAVGLARRIRPGWRPNRVYFAHPARRGAELAELVEVFGVAAISFRSPFVGVAIDWRTGSATGDPLDPVRDAIRVAMRSAEPTVETVARTLGTSTRTLQRSLRDSGTSFRTIAGQVRADQARVYLRDRSWPLEEVALLLGYADARAFGRAYKRWTGRTPGVDRRR